MRLTAALSLVPAMIKTTAQVEIDRKLGPKTRTPIFPAEVTLEGVRLIGEGLLGDDGKRVRVGTKLTVRLPDLPGSVRFVAIAQVIRSTGMITDAKWYLLESDRLELEEAFEAQEKAA